MKKQDSIVKRVREYGQTIIFILMVIVFCVSLYLQVNKNSDDITTLKAENKQNDENIKEILNKREKERKEEHKELNDMENRIIILEVKEQT